MYKLNKLGIPIFFIPLLLISGPLLPDLTVSLSAIIFLIFAVINKKYHHFNNKYFIFFLCFWIFISVNSIVSENISSIKSSLTYFRFGVFFVFLSYLFNLNDNFSDNFKKVILFSILILFVDSLIQYFVGYNTIGFPKSGRISSFFGEEKIMGSYIVKLVPIYISLYYFKKKIVKLDIKIVLILFICIILILLSKERSALGLFILYISLLSFIFFNKKRQFIIYFFTILTFLTLIFSTNEGLYNRFILQVINDSKVEVENKNADESSLNEQKENKFIIFTKTHDHLIKESYKMFLDKPVIGHGTKMFRYKCRAKYTENQSKLNCNTHPHNYYFQMLSENGLVGLLFLIIIFFYFLINYFKNLFLGNRFKHLNLFILPNIINLWPIIPHGNFFNNWISVTIFLSIGFYIGYTQLKSFKKD